MFWRSEFTAVVSWAFHRFESSMCELRKERMLLQPTGQSLSHTSSSASAAGKSSSSNFLPEVSHTHSPALRAALLLNSLLGTMRARLPF